MLDPRHNACRFCGNFACSRLRLKPWPKLIFCRLSWEGKKFCLSDKAKPFVDGFNIISRCFQNQPRNWKSHQVQALLEEDSKVPEQRSGKSIVTLCTLRNKRTSYSSSQVDGLFQLFQKKCNNLSRILYLKTEVKEQTCLHHPPTSSTLTTCVISPFVSTTAPQQQATASILQNPATVL